MMGGKCGLPEARGKVQCLEKQIAKERKKKSFVAIASEEATLKLQLVAHSCNWLSAKVFYRMGRQFWAGS
jgi:hypothetical protein